MGSIIIGKLAYPLFGWDAPIDKMFGITLIYTIWAIGRGYIMRRIFNKFTGGK